MDSLRMKIEIGDRKFEAEGPADVVQTTFNAFMKLCGLVAVETVDEEAEEPIPLEKIIRVNGGIVSLGARARSVSEALLVLLLGQRELRSKGLVSGSEIMHGLRASGIKRNRVDHLLNTHARKKYLNAIGKRRGRQYQLTKSGVLKAEEIARGLIATVQPPPISRGKPSPVE